jgi:hypothetical protein
MENLKSIFELVAAHPIVSLFLAVVFLESIIVIFKGCIAIIAVIKNTEYNVSLFKENQKRNKERKKETQIDKDSYI